MANQTTENKSAARSLAWIAALIVAALAVGIGIARSGAPVDSRPSGTGGGGGPPKPVMMRPAHPLTPAMRYPRVPERLEFPPVPGILAGPRAETPPSDTAVVPDGG